MPTKKIIPNRGVVAHLCCVPTEERLIILTRQNPSKGTFYRKKKAKDLSEEDQGFFTLPHCEAEQQILELSTAYFRPLTA